MNKYFLIIAILFAVIAGFGQSTQDEFKASIGELTKYRDSYFQHYSCPKEDYLFVVKLTTKDKVYLTQYDTESMKEVSVEKYKDFPKHCTAIDLVVLDDELYYIYAGYNRGASNFDIYSRKINAKTGVFELPKLLVTTSRVTKKIRNQFNYASYTARNLALTFAMAGKKFHIFKSADDSKLGIVYELKPEVVENSENNSAYGVFVYDGSFEKIWGDEISMPYIEEEKYEDAMLLTNNGEFKILARGELTPDLELYTLSSDKKISSTPIEVSLTEKVNRFAAGEDANGNIIFVGLYAKSYNMRGEWNRIEKETVTSGMVQFSVDQEGSLTSFRETKFDETIAKMNLSPEQIERAYHIAKGDEIGLLNFVPVHFRVNEDGSSMLIGEGQRLVHQIIIGAYQTTGIMGAKSLIYYFGNIVYFKMKRSGEIDFVKKVPKNQESDGYPRDLSFSHYETDQGNFFVYMDDYVNQKRDPIADDTKTYISGRGGWLTLAFVDAITGDLKRYPLIAMHKLPGDLTPRDFKIRQVFAISQDVFMAEVRVAKKKQVMLKFER